MADHSPPARRRRARPRHGRGFSYIEVVITLALTGIVVLPILAAVRSSIDAASVSRTAAEVETVLINAADRVSRADRLEFPCDLTIPAKRAAASQDATWSGDDISVEHAYWVEGTDGAPGGWQTEVTACPGGVDAPRPPFLVQRITILVTSPDGRVRRALEVVKGEQ